VGKEYIINQAKGYLQSKICCYLMNLHITPRAIYLTRVCLPFPPSPLFNLPEEKKLLLFSIF